MNILIRRAEPTDYEAVRQVFSGPQAIWGTLQLPFPSAEGWRKRLEPAEGVFSLVACVENEVVGQLGLHTFPNAPRRRFRTVIQTLSAQETLSASFFVFTR